MRHRSHPKFPIGRLAASYLRSLDRPDEAASWFGKTIAINPGHARAHYMLGKLAALNGDDAAAIDATGANENAALLLERWSNSELPKAMRPSATFNAIIDAL